MLHGKQVNGRCKYYRCSSSGAKFVLAALVLFVLVFVLVYVPFLVQLVVFLLFMSSPSLSMLKILLSLPLSFVLLFCFGCRFIFNGMVVVVVDAMVAIILVVDIVHCDCVRCLFSRWLH